MTRFWKFEIVGLKKYELVLVDLDDVSMPVLYFSGYRSVNLQDILEAAYYLNGGWWHPHLTERQIHLLDDIQRYSKLVAL